MKTAERNQPERPSFWVQTHSGGAVDLIDPRPEMIHFSDVAVHLSRAPRFNGATTDFAYSVAQHCVIGARHLYDRKQREAAQYFLLHDAHEFVIGDIATPAQQAIAWHGMNEHLRIVAWGMFQRGISGAMAIPGLRELKSRVDHAIHTAAGVAWPPRLGIPEIVHQVDLALLRSEQLQVMAKPPRPWGIEHIEPLRMKGGIKAMTAIDAELLWLEWFDRLFPGVRR